jgi:hypothetical protein
MKAEPLLDERYVLGDDAFVELVIWQLPEAARGSRHRFKYRLALVIAGECVLRYDNEAGKGDHRHVRNREETYSFMSPERLLQDFWTDVDEWRRK